MHLFEHVNHLVGWIPTGSSYICEPPVLDTDEDFVIYTLSKRGIRQELEDLGYIFSTKDVEKYRSGNTDPFAMYNSFDAYRHTANRHNLIVVDQADDFLKWKVATLVAKQLNVTNKEDRVTLFRAIRSGGKLYQPPKPDVPKPEAEAADEAGE